VYNGGLLGRLLGHGRGGVRGKGDRGGREALGLVLWPGEVGRLALEVERLGLAQGAEVRRLVDFAAPAKEEEVQRRIGGTDDELGSAYVTLGTMGGLRCLSNPQFMLANHLCCFTSLAPD
jgi:hypothetical protein